MSNKTPHITVPSFTFGNEHVEGQYISNLTDAEVLRALTFSLALTYVLGAIRNPHLPVEELRRLGKHTERKVRVAVASSPRTPAEVLGQMSNNVWEHRKVLRALAHNPNTPAEALSFLAASEDLKTVRNVAGNRGASVETLREIAGREGNIAVALFGRADLPADVLDLLKTHETWDVRKAYYSSLYATAEELEEAVNEHLVSHPDIVGVVAGNSNTTPQVLVNLLSLCGLEAARSLVFNDNLPAEVIHALYVEMRVAIGTVEGGEPLPRELGMLEWGGIEIPEGVDAVDFIDEIEHLLFHLVLLPNVPLYVFWSVIQQQDVFFTLHGLLNNPQLPADIIELLTLHPYGDVKKEANRQKSQRALLAS